MDSKYHQNHQDEEATLKAMAVPLSNILSLVLHTAIELDLFNIKAKFGPGAYVSASKIASQLPITNSNAPSLLDRMLHLFVTHSILSYAPKTLEDGRIEKTYALTPASKCFMGKVEEGNISFMLRLGFHRANIETWLNMKNVILEGGNLFEKIHGVSLFEYMNKDEELNGIFNQAMVDISTATMNGILEKYKGFEGVKILVDVGGGIGQVLNMIISKYPSIKGINFDLSHVVQNAPSYSGKYYFSDN